MHLSYLAAAYRTAGKHEDCLKVLQRAVRLFPEIVDLVRAFVDYVLLPLVCMKNLAKLLL